ncbi:SDR family oxidoreductase [Nostoc sp. LEGE 12447]|uniref:SDR family oxidoreductase n=1 Tax=unclassified Nostoc TaxID=2593658 RepID=UPI00187E7A3C|nr:MULTISPECIES: SDR family oxidoreductase [unclassified Nostoc]MBE8991686.1 SDR family oxidoreductase [Nostoc sp. LEGE 12450]MBE9001556.1 SDR family oxidoreductase [Nostoc sp. LEGE 12447]
MILQDKVALVTGGTSGIGRATAIAYAQQQAKVVVVGRRMDEGEETVRLIQKADGEAIFVQADVTREADVKAMVDKAVGVFGRLDIAFNNAGMGGENPSLIEQTEAEYDRTMNVNVKGVWLSMKYEIAQMLKQGSGSIVNMASAVGVVALPNILLYTASKHAVVGLTKAAALQYAKAGIRINAVAPGSIQTDMFEAAALQYAKAGIRINVVAPGAIQTDMFEAVTDEAKAYITGLHPIGRIGTPLEVANAVLFLSSDLASFITGETLMVDGGYVAQ